MTTSIIKANDRKDEDAEHNYQTLNLDEMNYESMYAKISPS